MTNQTNTEAEAVVPSTDQRTWDTPIDPEEDDDEFGDLADAKGVCFA